MATQLEHPSLRNSIAYQRRIPITAAILGLSWAFVAFSQPLIGRSSAIGWTTEVAAWLAFFFGMFIRAWATLWIAGRKKRTVVNDGPYRICRNPLYLGTFAMGLGLVLFFKSAVFAIAFLMIVALYVKWVVPAEEAYLRQRLGADYMEYCNEVPAWIPRMSRLRRNELWAPIADRVAVRREFIRMIWWITLPVLAEATCRFREVAWLIPLPEIR